MSIHDEQEIERLRAANDDLRKQLNLYRDHLYHIESIASHLCSICPYDFRRAILKLIDEAIADIKKQQ